MADVPYQTHSFRFTNKGLQARFAVDAAPAALYRNLENLESRIEEALSTRYGRKPVNVDLIARVNIPLPAMIHTLARLKSLDTNGVANVFRYAAAGTKLYRRNGDTQGAFTPILTGLSGQRFSTINYRPDFSAYPYLFIADAALMRKDDGGIPPLAGSYTPQLWGIHAPYNPVVALLQPPVIINTFDALANFITSGFTTITVSGLETRATGAVSSKGVAQVVPESMSGIRKNMLLRVDAGTANEEVVRVSDVGTYWFSAVFTKPHSVYCSLADYWLQGTIAGDGTGVITRAQSIDLSVSGTASLVSSGADDIFRLGMLLNGSVKQNILARPTVLINGWKQEEHVGDYEIGFGTSTEATGNATYQTLPYWDQLNQVRDDDVNTRCYAIAQHTHQYCGCVWNFNYSGPGADHLVLNILSEIPANGYVYPGQAYVYGADGSVALDTNRTLTVNDSCASLWYTLNGGQTWTQIYKHNWRPKQWDSIVLPKGQDITKVQVLAFMDSHDNMAHFIYGMHIAEALTDVKLAFDVGDGSFSDYYEAQANVPALGDWQAVDIRRSSFSAFGQAGMVGKDWSKVAAFKISIIAGDAGLTASVDDLSLVPAGGPDVTGGVAYDYRITGFNINTGSEGPPSPTMIEANRQWPENQGVQVSWDAMDDPQITHYRVYRRGGTLAQGWQMIAEVPIGTTTLLDTLADAAIFNNKSLELDNYPPVTSTLRVPVDTKLANAVRVGVHTVGVENTDQISVHQVLTIDATVLQENVIVQAVDPVNQTITAYFQYAHARGARGYGEATYGKPARIATAAFERAWIAGDEDNPGRLYYSKRGQMESFPPQNYLDLGSPSDPILGMVEVGGYLWVGTFATWYRIFSPTAGSAAYVNTSGVSNVVTGSTPQSVKTGSRHGLADAFAWCKIDDDVIYRSHDGIYSLRGQELSALLQWLFRDEATGPLSPMDRTQNTVFGFEKNEVFISYVNQLGQRKRVIYSHRDQRWRNDDVAATAMLLEEDTAKLLIGRADGMIFEDRTGDVDWEGFTPGVSTDGLRDDFNRPDAPSLGAGYSTVRGSAALLGGEVKATGKTFSQCNTVLPHDQWAEIRVAGVAAPNRKIGLALRWLGNTYIAARGGYAVNCAVGSQAFTVKSVPDPALVNITNVTLVLLGGQWYANCTCDAPVPYRVGMTASFAGLSGTAAFMVGNSYPIMFINGTMFRVLIGKFPAYAVVTSGGVYEDQALLVRTIASLREYKPGATTYFIQAEFTAPHPFIAGQQVSYAGVTNLPDLNGTAQWVLSVDDATHITTSRPLTMPPADYGPTADTGTVSTTANALVAAIAQVEAFSVGLQFYVKIHFVSDSLVPLHNGDVVTISQCTYAPWLNGQTLTISDAQTQSLTAPFDFLNAGPGSGTGTASVSAVPAPAIPYAAAGTLDTVLQPGDLLRFEVRGWTLRLYHNGVLVFSDEDLTHLYVSGYAAFTTEQDTPAAAADDFACGYWVNTGQIMNAPLNFTLIPQSLDFDKPKAEKNFNEVTLDVNTHGTIVQPALLLDNGDTEVALASVNTANRQQVQLRVNDGLGQLSRNVALKITGSTTARVDFYETHIRAALDAELRKSMDTWHVKYGTDEYKVVRQGFFEYSSIEDLTFSCYLDGEAVARFLFTLPASSARKVVQIKFPPWKFKTIRWVATSPSDFKIYGESQIEIKALVGQAKSWERKKLQETP